MTFFTVSLLALAEMTIYVYKKDGTKVPYLAATVDSIGFVENSNEVHEWVDLGLPSGTLWATCNVGAETPEECGYYFAWGEVMTKSIYNWSTYRWCYGTDKYMTKYCTISSCGLVDNKTNLELLDDAAYLNWGTDWRIPTRTELEELIYASYTTQLWTTHNGVKGIEITSKINGNSIFLPATGYIDDSGVLVDVGSNGNYWSSSSVSTDNSSNAWRLSFNQASANLYTCIRCRGLSVRPVLVK